MENARNMNFYVEFSSLEDVSDIINCIKAQGAQIYGVEIDHGKPEHIERPSAVFSIRLNQKIHHEQVLASIADLERNPQVQYISVATAATENNEEGQDRQNVTANVTITLTGGQDR